jgi:bifunctional DNase/RNase
VQIEMKIRGLMVDPSTNMPIVILKDGNSEALLPIWVGIFEARAIAIEIEKASGPRPMTHDLLKNIVDGLNGRLQRIVVSELRDDTFYAVVWMEQDGEAVAIDARPSDALALALRADCPIFVEEEVLRTAKVLPNPAEAVTDSPELRRWLEGLGDEDLGKYKM